MPERIPDKSFGKGRRIDKTGHGIPRGGLPYRRSRRKWRLSIQTMKRLYPHREEIRKIIETHRKSPTPFVLAAKELTETGVKVNAVTLGEFYRMLVGEGLIQPVKLEPQKSSGTRINPLVEQNWGFIKALKKKGNSFAEISRELLIRRRVTIDASTIRNHWNKKTQKWLQK